MDEKLEIMKNRKGFIAALDQSGGSSGKTLKLYGIGEEEYQTDEEMFEFIHTMRERVLCNEAFTNEKIIGVILFEQTMEKEIKGMKTAQYLWDNKKIISFLKIDKGLEEEKDGVCLMKEIPDLEKTLALAKNYGIFGTKMRSVIQSPNPEGIRNVIEQQFFYAKKIAQEGLVPIIEPEVSINSMNKLACEKIMKEEIDRQLSMLDENIKVMFKFTIPEIDDFYLEYTKNEKVLRVVALSGGYNRMEACQKLIKNHDVIASFSRALLEGLTVHQTEEEFKNMLSQSIDEIYQASTF